MSKKLHGIAASKGIVFAKAYKITEFSMDFVAKTNCNVDLEQSKFETALNQTIAQLDDIKQVAIQKLGAADAEVFEAHKTIVQDPELKTQVDASIASGNDAASSVRTVTDTFVQMFEMMEDEYFKARSADIKDVRKRLIANILDEKITDLSTINEKVIILAHDLTPSETSQLNKEFTIGFVTNTGGRTSHAAIMARTMEIPAVVGTQTILSDASDGDIIILNGLTGEVIINPTTEEISNAEAEADKYESLIKMQLEYKDKPSISKDGHLVELVANIGTPKDVEGALNNGAEGVGLYRTEFLYMDATELPSEDIQFEAYKKVLEGMKGKPVVVRTLDIGGDKELPYMEFPAEMNPFLGYRAIRMCLDRPEIFNVQLRALLRASAYGDLKIMFPMIATLGEFRAAKKMLMDQKDILVSQGIPVSDNIEVGIMVEIPSTAVMAETFAKEVDFFSIGTNDLIQYTMACDRMSERISYLYQPYNPAILRLVKNVVDAANAHGKWAGMCGEMASEPAAIVILLALGLHEFSMSSSAILTARVLISELDKKELEKHVDTILDMSTAEEVKDYIDSNLLA